MEFSICSVTPPHLSLVHQILIEGLLPAQLADRGLLHQLESFEHWLKLIEAHTSAWKLLQYLSLALDLVSQPWADSITFYLWVKLKLWQVYFRLYQTNKISFQKVSFTFCKYSFFPNSWNRRATKSNNVKFSKVQKVQIQIVGVVCLFVCPSSSCLNSSISPLSL